MEENKVKIELCFSKSEFQELAELLIRIGEEKLSKYQACKLVNCSRATFDNLVRDGKIPKGKKQIGFKELYWNKSEILEAIKNK